MGRNYQMSVFSGGITQNLNPFSFVDPYRLCADSFGDKFYGAIDRGATAINDWTQRNIADPVYDWGTGVND